MGKKTLYAALGVIGGYLLQFPARLLEHWVMGEIISEIQAKWQPFMSFSLIWVLPFLVAFLLVFGGYKLRGDKNKKSASISSTIAGEKAEPTLMVEVHNSGLIELKGETLIEVSLTLHATFRTNIGSVRLQFGGKYLDEYPEPRIGHRTSNIIAGNAWFLKPKRVKGQEKAVLWVNVNGKEWVSDEFTVDFDQQIELRN